jgi:hypothetical protein
VALVNPDAKSADAGMQVHIDLIRGLAWVRVAACPDTLREHTKLTDICIALGVHGRWTFDFQLAVMVTIWWWDRLAREEVTDPCANKVFWLTRTRRVFAGYAGGTKAAISNAGLARAALGVVGAGTTHGTEAGLELPTVGVGRALGIGWSILAGAADADEVAGALKVRSTGLAPLTDADQAAAAVVVIRALRTSSRTSAAGHAGSAGALVVAGLPGLLLGLRLLDLVGAAVR